MDLSEIEAPTKEQKFEAVRRQAILNAESGDMDAQLIAYMVTQGIKKEQAKKLIPEIRTQSKAGMKARLTRKKFFGFFLILTGIGIAAIGFFSKDVALTAWFVGGLVGAYGIVHVIKVQPHPDALRNYDDLKQDLVSDQSHDKIV